MDRKKGVKIGPCCFLLRKELTKEMMMLILKSGMITKKHLSEISKDWILTHDPDIHFLMANHRSPQTIWANGSIEKYSA